MSDFFFTTPGKTASTPFKASGVFIGVVEAVVGNLLTVSVPRLSGDELYENVEYIAAGVDTIPKIGEKVVVTFHEGRQDELISIGRIKSGMDPTSRTNAITLGDETVGDFVQSLVAGTGVTITDNAGEKATPTIAIGQPVETTATPTFGALTLSNTLSWPSANVGAPSSTTRSAGTKVVLWPQVGNGTDVDYALGIDSATFWQSMPRNDAAHAFKWYGGTTNIMTLSGTGELTVAGATTLSSTLNVAGATTLSSTLNLTGNLTFPNLTTVGIQNAAGTSYFHLDRSTGSSQWKVKTGAGAFIDADTVNVRSSAGISFATFTSTGTTITGNLTVNGTTTTVKSTTLTVDDPIVTLGGDIAPVADDNKDRGVEFRWHNGTTAKVGFFGFDDSTGKFTFIPDATNTAEVFAGVTGELDAKVAWANLLNIPAASTSAAGIVQLTDSTTTTSSTLAATATAVKAAADIANAALSRTGGTMTGAITSTLASGPQIDLAGATSNWITFGAGTGLPALTTRSVGTKVVLNNAISASTVDYALGVNTATTTLWSSVPSTAAQFQWYGAATAAATLTGLGALTLAAGTIDRIAAGTASVFNATATTVNIGGAATSGVNIGASTGSTTFANTVVLRAGTATAGTAPLRFTTGTNLTTPVAGSVEWDGTNLYITQGTTRKTVAYTDSAISGGSGSFTTLSASGAVTFNSAAPQLSLTNATSNWITIGAGAAAPAFTTRSVGTKVVLNAALGTTAADYAFGYNTNVLWSSVAQNVNTQSFQWYGGTTSIATLNGIGDLTLAGDLAVNGADITTTATGTATIFNTNATTVNIGQAATAITLGAATGTTTVANTLLLRAGSTTVAPMRFQTGTNLTTPVAGSVEWDGTNLYITQGTTRKTVAYTDSAISGTIAGTSLTGNTLASGIVTSSLTTVGTLGSLNVTGQTVIGGVSLTTWTINSTYHGLFRHGLSAPSNDNYMIMSDTNSTFVGAISASGSVHLRAGLNNAGAQLEVSPTGTATSLPFTAPSINSITVRAQDAGAEGGQIDFAGASTYGQCTIDNYAGSLRLFSSGAGDIEPHIPVGRSLRLGTSGRTAYFVADLQVFQPGGDVVYGNGQVFLFNGITHAACQVGDVIETHATGRIYQESSIAGVSHWLYIIYLAAGGTYTAPYRLIQDNMGQFKNSGVSAEWRYTVPVAGNYIVTIQGFTSTAAASTRLIAADSWMQSKVFARR
jgi:hypothetical protein